MAFNSCRPCYCWPNEVEFCNCGLRTLSFTSRTDTNPLRRFFKCVRGTVAEGGCGLWDWVDPEMHPHLKRMVKAELVEKKTMAEKLRAEKSKVVALEGEVHGLKEEVKNLNDLVMEEIVEKEFVQKMVEAEQKKVRVLEAQCVELKLEVQELNKENGKMKFILQVIGMILVIGFAVYAGKKLG